MTPSSTYVNEDGHKYQSWKTYKLNELNINSYVDSTEAMEQAIYKIIRTEKDKYLIYNQNYGVELADLIGKDKSYVCAVLKGRIENALFCDRRIVDIKDWVVTVGKRDVTASFTASTVKGNIDINEKLEF